MKKKKRRSLLNCVLLYNDHTYDVIREDKLNFGQLSSKRLHCILVPCTDRENLYIPMKPSHLYGFHRAHVFIAYNVFSYDMESTIGEDLISSVFETDCTNLIDLANALFNLYKFRGASIFISENLDIENSLITHTIYPIKIKVDFYNERNNLDFSIESRTMSSFTKHNPDKFRAFPPQYSWEDRFVCLDNLMFTPLSNPYKKWEPGIDGLPIMISLDDDVHWKPLATYKQALEHEFVFHKVSDFEAYYLMTEDVMQRLDLAKFSTWEVFLASIPICGTEDDPKIDLSRPIKYADKLQLYEDYHNENIFSIVPVRFSIQTFVDFITVYGFLPVILNYLNYFTSLVYAQDGIQTALAFVLFDDHSMFDPRRMLVDREVTPDSLAKTILYLMERSTIV